MTKLEREKIRKILVKAFELKCPFDECRARTGMLNHVFCHVHKQIFDTVRDLTFERKRGK